MKAGHDGDLDLKLKTIENLDSRIVKTVYEEVKDWKEPVYVSCFARPPYSS